ncbi:hypothetical protein [uncultured Polaribacter sp.]|uniref:hypothetical protein n=1 Tax=uncultured Polaribacter sp. TaxID=174711 RepID=UPI00262C35BB|nr:hypothetical protein [uncultured Polaribacter sp.]
MELTKEQIQKINLYLDSKNLYEVDIRLEVLDHITTAIETKMEVENVDFHYAFAETRQQWNPNFKETTSMFFGLGFSAPKMVVKKAKSIFWKHYILLLTSYFIPFLLLTHFNFKVENPAEYSFFLVLKVTVGFALLAFFYMLFFRNNKVKTTYGFILKSQSLGVLTGLLVFVLIMNRANELNEMDLSMVCFYLMITASYFTFFRKHQKAIQKYKVG